MSEIGLRDEDKDLVRLLRKCDDQELETLVVYITQKGSVSSELEITNTYKKNNPKHSRYADEIAAEVQKFGGNTIANIFRGKGVLYREIVCDVADKLKVNYNSRQDVASIEMQILFKILEKSWDKMTDAEKMELLEAMSENNEAGHIPKIAPLAALQVAIRLGGFRSYQLALIIANAVAKQLLGRGLSFAANAALERGLSVLAGPIGWAITGILTVLQISGPAYRVTIPCVIHIAMLRQRVLLKQTQPSLLRQLET